MKETKRDEFAPGFMVWAGVSAHEKTTLACINMNMYVNSDTYIQKLLGLFVRKYVPHKFPGELKNSMVFY